jgi:hypothetical protein
MQARRSTHCIPQFLYREETTGYRISATTIVVAWQEWWYSAGYGGSPIAIHRKLDAAWLFPQEKAASHVTK